jgi:hypothetical protein
MLSTSDEVLPKGKFRREQKHGSVFFLSLNACRVYFAYNLLTGERTKRKINLPPPPPTLKTKLIGKNLTSHTQKSATDDLHAVQQNNLFKAFIHTN